MEKFDAHEVAEKIMAAIQKEAKELKTLNVMILGKTVSALTSPISAPSLRKS